jgi:hypothetical protein
MGRKSYVPNWPTRVYKTTANPAVLLDNSFNRKVPVEVVIGIQGDLASPEPDFNIEFPTVMY